MNKHKHNITFSDGHIEQNFLVSKKEWNRVYDEVFTHSVAHIKGKYQERKFEVNK